MIKILLEVLRESIYHHYYYLTMVLVECVCSCDSETCGKISKVLAAFFFPVVIIVPILTQIILQTRITSATELELIILSAACIQTGLSIVGSFALGFSIAHDRVEEAFCSAHTNFAHMFYGGYTLYYLPPWVLINMASSWHYLGNGHVFNWYTHLMTYLPILVYVPILLFSRALAGVLRG